MNHVKQARYYGSISAVSHTEDASHPTDGDIAM